jgi:hypothetical protein
MYRTAAIALLAVLIIAAAGCGSGGEGETQACNREQGAESTMQGSYQVKTIEDDRVQGVGIYDNGSFRLVLEGVPRMVIHNEVSGESWLVDIRQKQYEPISYDEALLKAGFMPHVAMKPYFDLERFWSGDAFRMDTPDGRSIKAYLGGPDCLPSGWEAEEQGRVFKDIIWEYRRVGQVSPKNFEVPEGFSPSA